MSPVPEPSGAPRTLKPKPRPLLFAESALLCWQRSLRYAIRQRALLRYTVLRQYTKERSRRPSLWQPRGIVSQGSGSWRCRGAGRGGYFGEGEVNRAINPGCDMQACLGHSFSGPRLLPLLCAPKCSHSMARSLARPAPNASAASAASDAVSREWILEILHWLRTEVRLVLSWQMQMQVQLTRRA